MKTDAVNSMPNLMDFSKLQTSKPDGGRPEGVGAAKLTVAPEGSGIAGAKGAYDKSSPLDEIKDKLKDVIMKLVDKLVAAGDKGGAKGESVDAIKQAIMDLVDLLTKLDDKGSKNEAPGRSPFASMPPLPSMPNVQSLNSMPKPEFSPMPSPELPTAIKLPDPWAGTQNAPMFGPAQRPEERAPAAY